MRKPTVALLLGLLATAGLSALPADVVYAEGEANIRFRSGSQREAGIGDRLNTGDTLKTGSDGLVELDQKGVRLNIASNTVFTLMEKERGGKTAGVFSLVLGSVKFRYERLTGQEPLIQTNSCVAGVRGTEFSVFAGVDGSALIVVDRGEVTVEAAGQSVALAPDEGVEVRPGQPPGDKFKVQRDQVDYSKWNEDKLALMLQDPVSALTSINERLDAYIRDIEEYWTLYRQYKERLDAERQTMVDISVKQGKEQARRYNLETVMPVAAQTANLFLNVRYFTLAAFSLRRFVGARLYLFLKAQSFAQAEEPLYREFLDGYERFLDTYEGSIVPHLVEADI
jgi:hypothetical protein